ncbi:hypothetical protein ENSA5_02160 [Enhygromyxa salina]|uniref:Uncharacterized protein n=1 Tax=Enhygromyxa salina TaxID=215803 RepID=A0A2S9YK65_9BACT|nr:hypothetical protein ENSA5_02160 [Enhygromyxa salina]
MPTAPPKRRLGKLELAILIFLGFDLLVFATWRLLASDRDDAQAVADASDAAPAATDTAPAPAPAEEQTSEEPGDGASPASPAARAQARTRPLSVQEAIASELPPEPESPGPVRPMNRSLSEKDFREAMVDARDDIVKKCLDSRMRRTLKVSVKVAPNGEVTFARVLGALADTQLGSCVVKHVYRVEFPATHEGGTDTYTLRLR